MADTDAVAVRALLDMSDELLEMVGLAALAADPSNVVYVISGRAASDMQATLGRVRGLGNRNEDEGHGVRCVVIGDWMRRMRSIGGMKRNEGVR